MAWMLIALFSTLLICIYKYYTRNNDYWKIRNVQHETPTFLFGNFKEVIQGQVHFGEMYARLYKKFKTWPYYGYFKLDNPGIVINDPELIKTVLVKEFNSFMDNDFQVDPIVDPVWNANLFAQTGEGWKKNRAAWSQGMTSSKIKMMHEIMIEKSQVMIHYLKNHPEEPIEARDLVSKFFTDVIVRSIFGLELDSFEKPLNPFRTILKNFLVSSFKDRIITLTFLIAPWLGKIFKFKFVPKNVEDELLGVSKSILENRRANGYQKNNILDSMLLHVGDVNSVTEIDVAGFLFNFLSDGTETSAGVAAYLLYSIAANPDVQSKLRNEVDDVLNENGGKITSDGINQLTYLDLTISETMRLYPAVLTMQRICTKSYELPSMDKGKPFKIPVGMSVIIPVYGIHMDPEYYPDPEKFDPERFNEDNKQNIPKFAYLPFGEGPRLCIGSRLAMAQTKIGVATILRNFEIRLSKQTVENPPTVDPNIFIMVPPKGLWLTFHERKMN